jgi:hypothetical protein
MVKKFNFLILATAIIVYSIPSKAAVTNYPSMPEAFSACTAFIQQFGTAFTGCGFNGSPTIFWAIQADGNFYGPSQWGSTSACPGSFDFSTGLCAQVVSCASLGFDPTGFNPNGFCPNAPASNISSTEQQCSFNETNYNIPACTLVQCPNGDLIDPNLATCPPATVCWDGSTVYGNVPCPDPDYICPNGDRVSNQSLCPQPTEDLKACWDGSTVPVSSSCPTNNAPVHCADGTTAASISGCPGDQSTPSNCSDGSIGQSPVYCPSVNIVSNTVGDSLTSTTIYNSDGSGSQTTYELNLDGVNSRLDKIKDALTSDGFQGSGAQDIYTPGTLTFDSVLDGFKTRVQNSAIGQASTNLFTVTIANQSCPIWTIPAISQGTFSLPSFTIDQQCSSVMLNVWPIIAAVLLSIATFYALRVAFL